jgi:hypothetical protein
MTNADTEGHFTVSGVPAGGFEIEFRRNGLTIGRGTAISSGERLTAGQLIQVESLSAEMIPKPGKP